VDPHYPDETQLFLKDASGLATGRYLLYKAALLEHPPVLDKLPGWCWQCVATLREVAWGTRTQDELAQLRERARRLPWDHGKDHYDCACVLYCLRWADQQLVSCAWFAAMVAAWPHEDRFQAQARYLNERAWQLAAAFCVLRNPLVLTPVQEAWEGGVLADLALECVTRPKVYPILADALEEVGADREAIRHCRHRTHAHGCWVLDGLIKKAPGGVGTTARGSETCH